MTLGVAVHEHDRHGRVAPPLELVLAPFMRAERHSQPGAKVSGVGDHGGQKGSPADNRARLRVSDGT
jgi:hypothetical protein